MIITFHPSVPFYHNLSFVASMSKIMNDNKHVMVSKLFLWRALLCNSGFLPRLLFLFVFFFHFLFLVLFSILSWPTKLPHQAI